MKNIRKQEKGITLIALVVTIIVLLILAGVSIQMLTGQNGILNRAGEAAIENEIANVAETIELLSMNQTMDSVLENTDGDILDYLSSQGIINEQNIIDTQKLLGTNTKYGKGTTTDVFKLENGKIVYINEKGEITTEREVDIKTEDFITEWAVAANDIIVLPIAIGYTKDNDFIVDWGDGSPTEKINDTETALNVRPQHKYTEKGSYKIKISGKCSYFTLSSIAKEYPEQLKKLTKLISWGEIKARAYDFSGAINLTGGIPSPQKNAFKYIEEENFSFLFEHCEKITTIPSDLFANIPNTITSFNSVFSNCRSLESIPEGLFDKATNVTSYRKAFARCEALTNIPSNLFAKSPEVTSFEKTFYRCNKIRSIPSNLFKENTKVTNFKYTFYDLKEITIVPELWKRDTAELDGTGCFGSCDVLNTNGIPAPWANSET